MKKIRKITLVLLFIFLLWFVKSCERSKEILYEFPGTLLIGEELVFEVKIPANPGAVNAASVDINFDKNFFWVKKIEENTGFFREILEKEYDNNRGWLRLSGGLANPGWNKKQETIIARIYLETKKVGKAKIRYAPSSILLYNDGVPSKAVGLFGTWQYKIEARP